MFVCIRAVTYMIKKYSLMIIFYVHMSIYIMKLILIYYQYKKFYIAIQSYIIRSLKFENA